MFTKFIAAIKNFFATIRVTVRSAKEERKVSSFSKMTKKNKLVYSAYLFTLLIAVAIYSFAVIFVGTSFAMPLILTGAVLIPLLILTVSGGVMGFGTAFIQDKFSQI